jgi:hypothetical protein
VPGHRIELIANFEAPREKVAIRQVEQTASREMCEVGSEVDPTIEVDRAMIRFHDAGSYLQKRRFPAAVSAQKNGDPPHGAPDGRCFQNHPFAERLAD